MKGRVIVFLCIVFATISCNSQDRSEKSIENIDISNDDTKIIFSLKANNTSSIYYSDIEGNKIKALFVGTNENEYVNPRYTEDGKKIIFISHNLGDNSNAICIANQDGSNLKSIPVNDVIVTEAVFSLVNNTVFFCGAKSFNKSSPIGIKSAHDFDIYVLNIEDESINKLSELNSYNINNISIVDSTYILMKIENGPSGGMYALPINDHKELIPVVPTNNPRKNTSLYYHPIFSERFKSIAFIAPYELYIMDVDTKTANLVFGPKDGSGQFKSLRFFNKEEKILFTKVNRNGIIELMSIKYDGSDLKKIHVNIP